MNQDTQKQFVIKLLLVSGVGCLVWSFIVKPAHEKVDQQRQTLKSQESLIQAYNSQIGLSGAELSIDTERQLERMLGAMTSGLDSRDSDTSLHSLLNESAEHAGVSIAKIDSLKAGEVSSKIPQSQEWIKGVNQTVRIEFDGSYGSVMTFIDDVVSSPIPVAFTSLSVVQIGAQRVRVKAEIDSVVLTSIPDLIQHGGLVHE